MRQAALCSATVQFEQFRARLRTTHAIDFQGRIVRLKFGYRLRRKRTCNAIDRTRVVSEIPESRLKATDAVIARVLDRVQVRQVASR